MHYKLLEMVLVRAQDESVINSAYVKSWGVNFDAEVKIICHLTGESEPRTLWNAGIDDHPDAHMAVMHAYEELLDFLSGSKTSQHKEDEELRIFSLSVSVSGHRR